MRIHTIVLLAIVSLIASHSIFAAEEEPVFSGPQVGEKLTAFKVKHVFGDKAGEEFDPVTDAAGKPMCIVFVHEVTRPSVGMTRLLMTYAAQRSNDGLHPVVVFLTEDATKTEEWMKVAKHALPDKVPLGISSDGQEGPGAFGLNREMSLTVLIAKDDKVTANFALVQPSIQADAPKILKAMVDVLGGGEVPTLASLGGDGLMRREGRPAASGPDERLAGMLRAVIQLDLADDRVDAAAKALDDHVAKNEAAKRQVGQIASRIVNAGKLENYGTPRAREHIQRWAKEYGPANDAKPRE